MTASCNVQNNKSHRPGKEKCFLLRQSYEESFIYICKAVCSLSRIHVQEVKLICAQKIVCQHPVISRPSVGLCGFKAVELTDKDYPIAYKLYVNRIHYIA